MKFWVYSTIELIELKTQFEEVFKGHNLYHDYENFWEWIESENRNSSFYLNISRAHHDWQKSRFNEPIIIMIEPNNGQKLNEEEIALMMKDKLECEVFAGEISIGKNDKIIIGRKKKY